MTMKMLTPKATKEATFPMHEMRIGQVCCAVHEKRYVVRVARDAASIFLILGTTATLNTYSSKCGIPVRALRPGETVTIEFS